MSATPSPTARPPRAAIAWATPDALYVEYPVKGSDVPYVVRYPLTMSSLQTAFNLLIEHAAPAYRPAPSHPAIKRTGIAASEEARSAAAEVVKRLFR